MCYGKQNISSTRGGKEMRSEFNVISEQSIKYPKVQGLMHHVNKENLLWEHKHTNAKKAVGVDGVTKAMYEENLDTNLDELLSKMKTFSYRPKPTRKVEIPKDNGKTRCLGISSYEDKLVEGVMADVLSAVYEPRFHDCSYGFRPNRNMHQAIGVINHSIMFENINYVIDFDIKGCFDNIDHKWLMKFLENDIQDKNYLRYIVRFLKSGILQGELYLETDVGVKQGNRISPTLANVYLHYVLDEWFEKVVNKYAKGNVRLVRFADDAVILCQFEKEAKEIFEALPKRLARFGLEMNNDKSKIIPFGRFKGTKETFDFLGFTFINGKTIKGDYRPHILTSKKKMKKCKQNIKRFLRDNMHSPIAKTMDAIVLKLRGHYNYYGINGNFKQLLKFQNYVKCSYYRILRRRGQKRPIKYMDFLRIWNAWDLPKVKIYTNIWF